MAAHDTLKNFRWLNMAKAELFKEDKIKDKG